MWRGWRRRAKTSPQSLTDSRVCRGHPGAEVSELRNLRTSPFFRLTIDVSDVLLSVAMAFAICIWFSFDSKPVNEIQDLILDPIQSNQIQLKPRKMPPFTFWGKLRTGKGMSV